MNITLKRENVIRITDSEDRAKVLEAQGFERLDGAREKTLEEDVSRETSTAAAPEPVAEEPAKTSTDDNSRGKKNSKKE